MLIPFSDSPPLHWVSSSLKIMTIVILAIMMIIIEAY